MSPRQPQSTLPRVPSICEDAMKYLTMLICLLTPLATALFLSGCSDSDGQGSSASARRGEQVGQVALNGQTYVLVQYGGELAVFLEEGSPVTSRDTAERVLISYVWSQVSTQSALTRLEAIASRTGEADSQIASVRRLTNRVVRVFDELHSLSATVPFVGRVSAMDTVRSAYPGVDTGETVIRSLDGELNRWGVNSSALSQANARLKSFTWSVEVDANEAVRTFGSVEEAAGNLSDSVGEIKSVAQDSLEVARDLRSALREASDTPVIGSTIESLAAPVGNFGDLLSDLTISFGDYQGELSEVQGQFSAVRSSYEGLSRSWTANPYDTVWPPKVGGGNGQAERPVSTPEISERGRSVPDSPAGTEGILRYWSIPALLVASVLTVIAIARATWRAWQPHIIAVMSLGVLAILSDASVVVFGYPTVDTEILTPLALISFVVVCLFGWIVLNPEQFPALSGAPSVPPRAATSTVQGPPTTPTPPSPASEATSIGGPSAPVAAAVPTPSETMVIQPDVARTMAWLVVTRGPSEGKSVQLNEGNNTIGRSLDNDIQIDDASVSRSHAMLSVKDDRFTLVDLGSASGTRVGDHRISGRPVGAGSIITVGQTRLSLMDVKAFQGGASSGATMVGSPSGSSLSLVAQTGPDAGKSFLLTSSQNVIGREPSAQVVLTDPTVSRSHAMLRVEADRTTISDLGSRSGTQVDGEIISGVRITIGDHISIGQSEFTLMRPSG